MSNFRGRKSDEPYYMRDTIRSTDTIEAILGVGEGENFGLALGPKSLYLGKTPLVNSNGEANFNGFSLSEYTGTALGNPITPSLGGFGSPQTVQVNLAHNSTVTRQGVLTQYDYMDLRFVISQLVWNKDDGAIAHEALILIEQKASNSATWLPAELGETEQPYAGTFTEGATGATSGYELVSTGTGGVGGTGVGGVTQVVTFPNDGPIIYQSETPGAPSIPGTIWINISGQPNHFTGAGWALLDPDGGVAWDETTPPDMDDDGIPDGSDPDMDGDGTPDLVDVDDDNDGIDDEPDPILPEWVSYGQVRYYKPALVPPSNLDGVPIGSVFVPMSTALPPRQWNGSSWVTSALEDLPSLGLPTPAGVLRIYDKVTSPVVREIRIKLSRRSVPTDVRVTLKSPNTFGGGKRLITIGWESFEEIAAVSRIFPNTHILHLVGKASDQLNGFPEMEGDIKGRIVKVPTNYDPITRTYAGVWDFTYKLAYTDNGAFCTQDFVESTRYGLSALYPQTVNKSAFYEWAQWCDAPVPNGQGGTRPRWTYNDDLAEPRAAKEQSQYMAGACGARLIDDGSGRVDVLVDRDEEMSIVFGPQNVVDGEFIYSFTDIQTRANWIKVGFMNPALDWVADYRVVKDQAHIDEFGRIPMSMIAAGKINESEALASARLRLVTSTTETTMVTFRTNRLGKFLKVFNIIGICDEDMGWGIGGRIRAKVSARSVTLRDAITLEAGVTYTATFNYAAPAELEGESVVGVIELPITSAAGTHTTLTFGADLPANLPEFAQFSLNAPNQIGVPKPFKILSIVRADGDGEAVEIMALELNRNKWAYVDGTIDDIIPVIDGVNYNGPVARVGGIGMSVNIRQSTGSIERALQIVWEASSNPMTQRVEVEMSRDGNHFALIGSSVTDFFELPNVDSGIYWLRLTRVHIDGQRRSQPQLAMHQVESDVRSVPPVMALTLVDELSNTVSTSTQPKFGWLHGDIDPNFKHYQVQILDPTTSAVRRTVTTPLREFVYDFDMQKADGAGVAARSFKVSVTKIDDFDNASYAKTLSVTNPTPAAPVLTLTEAIGGVTVTLAPSVERDVLGALLWLSTTTGFDPVVFSPTEDANQQSWFIAVPTGETRYVRAAYYDAYGKEASGLNISGQASSSTLTVTADDLSPELVQEGTDAAEAHMLDAIDRIEQAVTTERAGLINGKPGSYVLAKQISDEAVTRALALTSEATARSTAIATEVTNRAAAILAETNARGTAVTNEVTARTDADTALSGQISTVAANLSTETTNRTAAVTAEADARASADTAEATTRSLLATQVRGAYTGNDLTLVTTGLIYSERTARTNADNALATQITLLTAGAGEQFDPLKIWYFDTSVEGWDGNGTPVATAGWLRPANHASAAYVFSAVGIAADSSKYSQVRMRVRKTGAPTWAGFLWWRGVGDTTWDAARRVALTAPTYDANGIGLVTVSPTWTGTIDRIRVDMSAAQTATDALELDWVSIGRPSPGASSAALLEEQTARANADSAIATDVLTLTATVSGNTSAITAEQTARTNADAAEVTSRQALSAKLTGLNNPAAATLAGLTAGLVFDERTARVSADGVLATATALVQANLNTTNANVTSEQTARVNADNALASDISTVTATANAKNKTFRQATAPASGMITGDVWYDSDDSNKPYRYDGSTWTATDDSRIAVNTSALTTETNARVNADAALTTTINNVSAVANAKNKSFRQASEPTTGMTSGDIWFDSDDANKAYRFDGSIWAATSDTRIAGNAADIITEAAARATAVSAEATARQALSTKLTGLADPSGATLAGLSAGLIYDERTARVSADGASATLITALQTLTGTHTSDIATEITARTSADAAAASRIDSLYAGLNPLAGYSFDPTHQLWPVANPLPTNIIASGTAPITTRVTTGLIYGEKALKGAAIAVTPTGYQRQAASMKPSAAPAAGYVVCEWEVTVNAGDLKRAGFEYRLNYTSGYKRAVVELFAQHATVAVGQTYRGSKLVQLTDVSSSGSIVDQTDFLWLNNASLFPSQTTSVKTLTFHKVFWREATAEEVAAGVTLPTVSASVVTNAAALVDINGRMSATWGVELNAGLRVAGIRLQTEGGGGTVISSFDVEADTFRVWNGASLTPAFEVSGGAAYVGGNLVRTGSVQLGALSSIQAQVTETQTDIPHWTTSKTHFGQLDSFTFTSSGEGKVFIQWTGTIQWNRAGANLAAIYLCWGTLSPYHSSGDDPIVRDIPMTLGWLSRAVARGNANSQAHSMTLSHLGTFPAGTHTVKVWGHSDINTSALPVSDVGKSFLIMEIKR
jgi:predicted phage tail protein